jgi:outer membrane receptor for ferrienterochelin and colicins
MKCCLWLCLFLPFIVSAQTQVAINVKDKGNGESLPSVTILMDSVFATTTDNSGVAGVSLTNGRHLLSFLMTGYQRLDTVLSMPGPQRLDIQLAFEEKGLEEVTIVASTRNNQNIENSPLKVEVLGPEEMSEEASIKPGNIASILGDVSGIQIQQTSAASGNSNVRIQGLEGRYTQILRDGMPLYDGFSGGFGILTIPPLDLRQIELIKGSASTLYGGGAIGGLINLISKRPKYDQTFDALVNYTTLREFNGNLFASKRNDRVGYTLFAGYNRQDAVDVNNDGFSDVPDAQSIMVHPRLFWYPNGKTMVSVGYSGTFDDRTGGDMQVLKGHADALHRYFEQNISQRHTGEYLAEYAADKGARYTFKGTVSNFNRAFESDRYALQATQLSYYSEASAMFPLKNDNLVAGINIVGDDYQTIMPANALLKTYANFTAGAFGQYSKHIKEHTIIDAGLRFDEHATYGLFVLPRIAGFHRFSEAWATRAGFGMGYKTPNPFAQQNIDYNVLSFLPVGDDVKPEISYGYNAEVNYRHKWGEETTLFINQAFFLTQVQRPIMVGTGPFGDLILVNAKYALLSAGSDTYIKLDIHHWELYAGYTYTEPRNDNMPVSQGYIPLTPKHRFAFVMAKEIGEKWRTGVEGSYTGFQYRYDGTTTPGYWFLAAMVQRNVSKHFIVVLNGENLLDFRMSKVESLYVGSITDPVFKPLWAPIDGRVINLSLRYKI